MTQYIRSPIAWPGTVGPDPAAETNPYVREDGGYILREDGTPLLRELDFSEEQPA
jgi:hypothetical protein